MTQAPERIWADSAANHMGEWDWDSGAWGHQPDQEGEVEYVRADLTPRWRPIEEWGWEYTMDTVFYDPELMGIAVYPEGATHFMQLTPPNTP